MEIQEIKSRLSILTVLNHYHLKPNKNSLVKCHFHEDDQPSLKIYPETNTFNCFGCNPLLALICDQCLVLQKQKE